MNSSKLLSLALISALPLTSALAQQRQFGSSHIDEMVRVYGAQLAYENAAGNNRVLLGVTFEQAHAKGSNESNYPKITRYFVVEAQLGMGAVNGSSSSFSQVSLKVEPVSWETTSMVWMSESAPQPLAYSKIVAAPFEVSRELVLGKEGKAKIHVIGFEAGIERMDDAGSERSIGVLANISVQAVGAQLLNVSMGEDKANRYFAGLQLGSAKAQLDLYRILDSKHVAAISNDSAAMVIRVSLVGEGDLMVASGPSGTTGVVSELQAYSRVALQLAKFNDMSQMELFTQAGVKAIYSGHEGIQTDEDRLPLFFQAGLAGQF